MTQAVEERRNAVTIYQGDCLAVMSRLADGSADMVLADLPYGTTYAPWDSTISLDGLWFQWLRVVKPGGAIVLTSSQPFTSVLVMSKPKLFRCEWIWDKVNGANFANANKQPMKTHESVLVFATEQPTYNPQKVAGAKNHVQGHKMADGQREGFVIRARGQDDTSGMKFPKSIQVFPKHSSQSRLHSTQKPVDMFAYFIRTYSNPGEVVLDCTAGSGTTGEAALREGRAAILIDDKADCIATMRHRLPTAELRA